MGKSPIRRRIGQSWGGTASPSLTLHDHLRQSELLLFFHKKYFVIFFTGTGALINAMYTTRNALSPFGDAVGIYFRTNTVVSITHL